uniref:Uncharacterized protein n=1 Tax=Arundo donax TaxID=35708 RepID=A0A0A9GWX2_ARUDO
MLHSFQVAPTQAFFAPQMQPASVPPLGNCSDKPAAVSSMSENIFLTFIVTFRTDWFQCQQAFLIRAGYMIGRITWRFWEIKSNKCSLFPQE